MKRFFILFISGLLSFSAPQSASAQMLDDLFDDEDFAFSRVEEMQKEEAKRREEKDEPVPAAGSAAGPASVPVSAAAAPAFSAGPATPVPAASPAPVSGALPAARAGASGTGSAPDFSGPATPAASAGRENAPQDQRRPTFSLSTSSGGAIGGGAPALPHLGSGKAPVPSLGRGRKTEDENLSLFEMRAKRTKIGDSNVMAFDIAGIRLKMTPAEVFEHAVSNGFSLKFKNHNVPTLDEWKYRRQCMQNSVFRYANVKMCIKEAAQLNRNEYVNMMVFENKARRETLTVEFTSNFSNNQAFSIRYVSKGDHSLGTTEEALYWKSKRRQDFLQTLIKKYGQPDDELSLLWGMAGLGATLNAEISPSFLDAVIVLEDRTMSDSDFDGISMEDSKETSTGMFSF